MPQSTARAAAHPRPANDRSSLYEEITSKIIAELEAGCFPWVQPWRSSTVRAPLGLPKNAATGRTYSGINVLILWNAVVERGFTVQSWLTFKQTLALGGHVRKGERGTTVVYADRFIPDDVRDRAHERGEEPRGIPFLKRFTVFNSDQCEGLPQDVSVAPAPLDPSLILPQVEKLTGVALKRTPPVMKHVTSRCVEVLAYDRLLFNAGKVGLHSSPRPNLANNPSSSHLRSNRRRGSHASFVERLPGGNHVFCFLPRGALAPVAANR